MGGIYSDVVSGPFCDDLGVHDSEREDATRLEKGVIDCLNINAYRYGGVFRRGGILNHALNQELLSEYASDYP